MDFENFGKLIRQLRKDLEIRKTKYEGGILTQETLTRILGKKSRRYIIDLENGKRSFVRPEELIKLADVFELTEMERKEFFLAGNGVPNTEIFREDVGIQTQQMLINHLHHIRLPAFLTSPFSDLIAANPMVADLYGIGSKQLEQFQTAQMPSNIIWFILSPNSRFFELGEKNRNWDDIIISNVQFFRRTSLHYRSHSYWKKLVEGVFLRDKNVAKRFKKYWDLARQRENLDCNIGRHYKLFRKDMGHLEFLSFATEEITTSASLYLTVYVPTDRHTSEVFAKLAKRHDGIGRIPLIRFSGNWPVNDNSHPRKWSYKIIS